jgi:hypothetical protein
MFLNTDSAESRMASEETLPACSAAQPGQGIDKNIGKNRKHNVSNVHFQEEPVPEHHEKRKVTI